MVSEVGFVWVDGLGRVIGFTPEGGVFFFRCKMKFCNGLTDVCYSFKFQNASTTSRWHHSKEGASQHTHVWPQLSVTDPSVTDSE